MTGGESRFQLEIGKNKEGYLDSDKYLAVVGDMLEIFALQYPLDEPVLVLDQSGECLQASQFNLCMDTDEKLEKRKAKAEEAKEELITSRTTTFMQRDPITGVETEKVQVLVTEEGRRIGLLEILKERNIKPTEEQGAWTRESAQARIAQEPDFKMRTSQVEVLCKEINPDATVIFSPKYHPEFNPVELFWAALKHHVRCNCSYTMAGLKNIESAPRPRAWCGGRQGRQLLARGGAGGGRRPTTRPWTTRR